MSSFFLPFIFIIFYALLFSSSVNVQGEITKLKRPFNNTIPAIFVFGDSTVDPGNNNYIITALKSNFSPYGVDFANHTATGRFTNGRLVTDFIASYGGIKEIVPPYLDPTLTLEDLMTGVSFASAGSGYDTLTAHIDGVIPIQKQLENFIEYKKRLEKAIGKEKTEKLINKSAFVISAATNDFVITYFGSQLRKIQYPTASSYQQFILQNLQQFTQGLVDQGARLIAIVGAPPMGCLPIVITLNPIDGFHHRRCVERFSSVGKDYNQKLQKLIKEMQSKSSAKFYYADIYTRLDDIIRNPNKYGFSNVNAGCCGTGLVETSYMCNRDSHVCSDRSKYVFWDSIHPTETTYNLLFEAVRPVIDDALKQMT